MSTYFWQFVLEKVGKLMPKNTITNLPPLSLLLKRDTNPPLAIIVFYIAWKPTKDLRVMLAFMKQRSVKAQQSCLRWSLASNESAVCPLSVLGGNWSL